MPEKILVTRTLTYEFDHSEYLFSMPNLPNDEAEAIIKQLCSEVPPHTEDFVITYPDGE